MKLLSLAVCVLIASIDKSGADLPADLSEIGSQVPLEKIIQTSVKYLLADNEFQEVFQYLSGKEIDAALQEIGGNEHILAAMDYLGAKGVHLEPIYDNILELLGSAKSDGDLEIKRKGMKGYVEEVVDLVPWNDIDRVVKVKVETSPDFKELFDKVSSIDINAVADYVQNSGNISAVVTKFRGYGIKVDSYKNTIKDYFGWNK